MKDRINSRLGNIISNSDDKIVKKKQEAISLATIDVKDSCTFRFDGTPNRRVDMVNRDILQYFTMELQKHDNTTRLIIRYGKIGRKCKIPIVSLFISSRDAATEANKKLDEKRKRGYLIDKVMFGQDVNYSREDS